MKFEFSAGGIVFKKDSEKIMILVCQHSQHHGWVFPKGHIGDHVKGEGKEETAIREVREETGIIGKILKPLDPIEYWYEMDKIKRKKTVYYFLMEFVGGDINKHDFEMENVEWLPIEDVESKLTYPSDKEVWTKTKNTILELS